MPIVPLWATVLEYCSDFGVDPTDTDRLDRMTARHWEQWLVWRKARVSSK